MKNQGHPMCAVYGLKKEIVVTCNKYNFGSEMCKIWGQERLGMQYIETDMITEMPIWDENVKILRRKIV